MCHFSGRKLQGSGYAKAFATSLYASIAGDAKQSLTYGKVAKVGHFVPFSESTSGAERALLNERLPEGTGAEVLPGELPSATVGRAGWLAIWAYTGLVDHRFSIDG